MPRYLLTRHIPLMWLLLVGICQSQPKQCYLTTTLSVERPGWFNTIREVSRPTVSMIMGKTASIYMGRTPQLSKMLIGPREFVKERKNEEMPDQLLLEMTPTLQGDGSIKLSVRFAVDKPGLTSRTIQTSSILEEAQPWEFSLSEEETQTTLHCKVTGWWNPPVGHQFGGLDEQRRPIWKKIENE